MSETVLLDASAVICLINEEDGADAVDHIVRGAMISAVNLTEVVSKLTDLGMQPPQWSAVLSELRLRILAFDEAIARKAGELRSISRPFGLSLGDRACLATAILTECPVLTCDRAWLSLANTLSLDIRLVR